MHDRPIQPSADDSRRLTAYYFLRFAVSAGWIALACTAGRDAPQVAAILLVAYPAWDALANFLDARGSGGLRSNPSQALNLLISLVAAAAVALTLGRGAGPVLAAFGAWAAASGLLQLATAVRRWKAFGAQWVMALSGLQSALAGAFFLKMAAEPPASPILAVAPYAGFGAFYFLLSAIWLAARRAAARRRTAA